MQVDYIVEQSDSPKGSIPKRHIKTDSELPPNIIKVYVYQPYKRIQNIKLNSNSPISILNRIYPTNSIYIYYGQILDVEKTFLYYGISNENKIVFLPFKSNCSLIDKYLKLTSDKESFEQRIDLNIKNNSKNELARLRDIMFNKFELKRKQFRLYLKSRNIQQYNLFYSNDFEEKYFTDCSRNNANDEIILKTDYDKADAPSQEPLPILW